MIKAVLLLDHLDRDTLLRPSGQAGLTALSNHRWAEPLRAAAATDASPDAIVAAHRAALWPLAQDINRRAR